MDRFFSHESIFESLASDPSSEENLEKLGVIASYSLKENTVIDTFVVWRKDLVGPGGYLKCYHYSEQAPPSLVDSIDEFYNHRPADQVTVFRHIKGPWYLYYTVSH